MPKTAIDKDRRLDSRDVDIGRSREILAVQPVPNSERGQNTPRNDLRLRIL